MPTTHDAPLEGMKNKGEIIKFYNATPAYRTVEEWVSFIDSLLDRAVKGERQKLKFTFEEYFAYVMNNGVDGTPMRISVDEVMEDIMSEFFKDLSSNR